MAIKLVVDASVAIKWFVEEPNHELAAAVFDDKSCELIAPDFIALEVTNVAWKKARRGELARSEVENISRIIFRGNPTLYSTEALMPRAIGLSKDLDHPVYDCVYAALAELLDICLLTADIRLHKRLATSRLNVRSALLGERIFALSPNEIAELRRLAEIIVKTSETVSPAFKQDKMRFRATTDYEVEADLNSPGQRSLATYLDALPDYKVVDFVAVCWVGGEAPSLGTTSVGVSELQHARERARSFVRDWRDVRSKRGYFEGLIVYFERGFSLLSS
jgi:predicted nucleic acid-binding protein